MKLQLKNRRKEEKMNISAQASSLENSCILQEKRQNTCLIRQSFEQKQNRLSQMRIPSMGKITKNIKYQSQNHNVLSLSKFRKQNLQMNFNPLVQNRIIKNSSIQHSSQKKNTQINGKKEKTRLDDLLFQNKALLSKAINPNNKHFGKQDEDNNNNLKIFGQRQRKNQLLDQELNNLESNQLIKYFQISKLSHIKQEIYPKNELSPSINKELSQIKIRMKYLEQQIVCMKSANNNQVINQINAKSSQTIQNTQSSSSSSDKEIISKKQCAITESIASQLQKEKNNLKIKLMQKDGEVNYLNQEKIKLQKQNSQLSKQKEKAQNQLASFADKFEQQIKQLKEKSSSYNAAFIEISQQNHVLINKCESQEKIIKSLLERISEIEEGLTKNQTSKKSNKRVKQIKKIKQLDRQFPL